MLPFPFWEGQPIVAAFGAFFFVFLSVIFIRKSRHARLEKAKADAPDGAGSNAWENISIAFMFTIIGIMMMLFGVYYLIFSCIATFPIVFLAARREARESKKKQEELATGQTTSQ